ncbi:hypothetical protein LZ30DRAFT_83326 [Colletotrichum cereale]|nr:hypothetical protein LZ30DRAFT_83326 [Colletotrichum cereale]
MSVPSLLSPSSPTPTPTPQPQSPSLSFFLCVPFRPSEASSDAPLQLFRLDSPITAFPSGRPVCNHRPTLRQPKAQPKSRRLAHPYCARAPLRRSSPQLRREAHKYLHQPRSYLIRPDLSSPTPIATRQLGLPSILQVNPRRTSSTNPKERTYPQLQQGDQEAPWPGRRYPLLGLEVGHSCGTRKRSHPLPAFFPSLCLNSTRARASYRPPQEDPS